MTVKRVLISECDHCGAEVVGPLPPKKRAALILPDGWMHVQGNTATTTVFELDLCRECSVQIRNAVGKGDKKR